jgi:oxaloacetate decarboxylase alpha subunit
MAKVLNLSIRPPGWVTENWAAGMPVGMMKPFWRISTRRDPVPLLPAEQLHFKKVIRDLKEDPWEMVACSKKAPRTKKGCILQPSLWPFDIVNFNREAVELYTKMLVDMGALQRVQITGNVMGHKHSTGLYRFEKNGARGCFALCYYISPRHTVEYYAEKKG